MRGLAIAAACLVGASASAGPTSFTSEETLVGWSADGERYAVIRGDVSRTLEVRDRTKVLATLADVDESVDVVRSPSLARYGLRPVAAAARSKFGDAYRLEAAGVHDPSQSWECAGGGWSIVRKADKKTVNRFAARNDHCFEVLAGYLDTSGKHALVRFTESSGKLDDAGDLSTTTDTKLALVVLADQ